MARLVRALARHLPEDERELIGLELGEGAHDPNTVSATPSEHTGAGTGPDWNYVWSALLEASAHAARIEDLLEEDRAFFDFEDITRAAGALREQIDSAYSLMCIAPWTDGLELVVGDDLDTVRRAVDLRRAEVVDAQLAPMRPEPAPDAPGWTIDYDERGGFVAICSDQAGDGTTPWKFWGAASTADSAAHTLTWYFLDRPPHIDFDPPLTPRPCVRMGPDSDRSPEGPSVTDLLERRVPLGP